MKIKKIAASLLAAGVMVSPLAHATNGMNLEGYGPVSQSMGGTSMAYDNGTAAVINNPATLGFMAPGTARLDVALGDLMPDASSQGAGSSAKNFYMPAVGYIRKGDNIAYGVGMMAQGGMGTEYANSSIYGGLVPMTGAGGALTDPGLKNKSEVGVGRLMFPIAYNVSPDLNIGGSIDYVWAGMDIKWLMDGAHLGNFMGNPLNPWGTVSGNMVTGPGSFTASMANGACGNGAEGCFNDLRYGYFDFDTSSTFSQKAKGTGYAGNIGFTFKINPRLTIGGVYHAKTSLSDMKTGSSEATASFNLHFTNSGAAAFGLPGGLAQNATVPLVGQVIIKNFQWPETYGLGLAYQVDDQWNVMADYKRIGWAGVMKNFNMTFIASGAANNGGFANTQMDLTYYQNWKDQDVFQLGAAYKYNDALTLRFGGNFANNPIPDSTVSPLFPAIMKTHYTGGLGYAFSKENSMDVSFVYAPKVTVTNNWSNSGTIPGSSNQTISLGGTSWQAMYSHRF